MMRYKDWEQYTDGVIRRQYKNYDEYIAKQISKLNGKPNQIEKFDVGIHGTLRKVLGGMVRNAVIPSSGNVLCLAARLGGEVRAFLNLGFFAIGIDLNPGHESKYVLHGDFHHVQFADSSIDVIYSNSADHALELNTFISEIWRLLKPDGHAIIESKGGNDEPGHKNIKSDNYDCVEWETHETLVNLFRAQGFLLTHEYRTKGFTPWGCVPANRRTSSIASSLNILQPL
jgi:SAM-dependent methyltransferase